VTQFSDGDTAKFMSNGRILPNDIMFRKKDIVLPNKKEEIKYMMIDKCFKNLQAEGKKKFLIFF